MINLNKESVLMASEKNGMAEHITVGELFDLFQEQQLAKTVVDSGMLKGCWTVNWVDGETLALSFDKREQAINAQKVCLDVIKLESSK